MRCIAFSVSVLLIAEVYSVWSIETFSIPDLEVEQKHRQVLSTNVEWVCTLDADCTTANSSCVNQRCQCPPQHVFNAAMTSCLKIATNYGGSCEETSQCTAFMQAGGFCNKGVCTCFTGYHYIHGRCHKTVDLYHKCRTDDDCYVNSDFAAVSCRNHCVCSQGYYQREYRTCRLMANESGAECTIDQDCRYDKNAKCDEKYSVCYVKPKSNTSKTATRDARYAAPKTFQDEVIDYSVSSRKACENDKECAVIGQAYCDLTSGMCVCKPGYFSDPTAPRCVPELGERCEEGDVSVIKHSICRFGLWGCRGATVASKDNRICRKATTTYGGYCSYDEECYVFGPDAVCEGFRCRCNKDSHYSPANKICWLNMGVGEVCSVDEDCYLVGFGSNLVCNAESVCACPKNTHMNVAGTGCVKDVPALGDACSGLADCKGLKNSMCRNEACTCAPSYFEWEGVCVAGIDAACEFDSDCKTGNSECSDKRCRCKPPYVPSGADLCVRGVNFGGDCQFDAECLANTTKSFCNNVGKCDCYNDHHYRDGRCYRIRGFGDECDWSNDECWDEYHPDSMSCNIHTCRCNEGYKPSYNWIYCEKLPNASPKYMFSGFLGLAIFATRFMGLL